MLTVTPRVTPFAMSPCHSLHGRPLDLYPLLDCHSVQHLVYLLSVILATYPVHFHLCFSVYSITSIVLVLFLISEHGTVSYSFVSNEQILVSSEQILVFSEQILASSEQILVSSEQILVSSKQILVSSEQILVSSKQILVSSEQILVSSEQILVSSEQILVSSKQILVSSEQILTQILNSAIMGFYAYNYCYCYYDSKTTLLAY